MEILLALFGSALLVLLGHWLLLRLLSPAQAGTMPVFAVIPAAGDGEGLEQTLRHLRWLQGEKLAPFTPLVVDAGLAPGAGPGPGPAAAGPHPPLLPGRGGHVHPTKER